MSARTVALVSEDYLPNIGGIAAHVHNLARALRALGHEAVVITIANGKPGQPRRRRPAWIERDGVPVLELGLASLLGRGTWWWLNRQMGQAVDRLHGDPLILHWHDATDGAHLVAPFPNAVRVYTAHSSSLLQAVDTGADQEKWRWEVQLADWALAPSRELATAAGSLGLTSDRITYIPNGVDPEQFYADGPRRQAARARLGVAPDDVVVLAARRVVPKNGIIDLAHALRHLAAAASQVRIVVAGDSGGQPDPYEAEVIGAVRKSPLRERVTFLGPVPNADMPDLYRAADISVLPSLKEATSIAGLEAMATGLPLVGTRVGGIPDLIEEGQTGLLVPPGDPPALGAAILALVQDSELRRRMGALARQRVLDHFTWESVAQQTVAVYEHASGVASARLGGDG